jgi:hypothetical protein
MKSSEQHSTVPNTPSAEGSNLAFFFVMGAIALGVLGLVAKALGLF